MCGEWEARLARAEIELENEQERCRELGEQLNQQLSREISLEATLAEFTERCRRAERVSEMLAKEAELASSSFDTTLESVFMASSRLDAILLDAQGTLHQRLSQYEEAQSSLQQRLTKEEEAVHEKTMLMAELEQQIVHAVAEAEQAKVKVEGEKNCREQLEQELAELQQALESAGRPPPGRGAAPATDKCIICGCVPPRYLYSLRPHCAPAARAIC